MLSSIWPQLEAIAREEHVARIGASDLDDRHADLFARWIEEGRHASMHYLAKNAEVRANPQARYPWAKSVIDVLGRQKYPRAYDPSAGIIRAGATACRLRRDVAAVTFAKLRDPAVSFFVETNPGHEFGDELCCIAPLTRENFSNAAVRPLRRGQALQVAVG